MKNEKSHASCEEAQCIPATYTPPAWPHWPQKPAHPSAPTTLISHWHRDVIKQRSRRRKPSNDTIEARTARAVSEILDSDISRGLRIIDGKGSAPLDNAAVIELMIEKHPRVEEMWCGQSYRLDG